MNSKDIEKQIAELEQALSTADGSSYGWVMMTVGFQAKKPPPKICQQWLKECGVIVENPISSPNRYSTTIPLVGFGIGDVPPNDWLLVKGLMSISGGDDNAPPEWWVHPLINQRYKEWVRTQD